MCYNDIKGRDKMTTIYLIRHSKTLKVNNDRNEDELQIQIEKNCLSIEGEQIAEEKMDSEEFHGLDIIFSSNHVRAIQTAKYLGSKYNLGINVNSKFGERKFGIISWDELPENFEKRQLEDENYKIGNGENQREVTERMYSAIMNILNEHKNKEIAIVSHATAISYLLKKWCTITNEDNKFKYIYNGNILLDGFFDYCETFKLVFDDANNLVDIENIKL